MEDASTVVWLLIRKKKSIRIGGSTTKDCVDDKSVV